MGDQCYNEPYGLQKLMQCDMVVLRLEASCCSHLYSVSSYEGTILTSKGSHHYRMFDGEKQLVMGINFKRPWFEAPYVLVQVVNCPAVKVVAKGGFSSSVLIVDEYDQTRLKIRKPMMSSTFKVLGADNIQVGRMKKDWGDWEVHFPLDLEVRYKAAIIASCIGIDLAARAAQATAASQS